MKHITSEFSKHGIAFSFFNAITPDLIDQVAKDVSLDITHADLKHCEVACLLSHVVLWQKAVDEIWISLVYLKMIFIWDNRQKRFLHKRTGYRMMLISSK